MMSCSNIGQSSRARLDALNLPLQHEVPFWKWSQVVLCRPMALSLSVAGRWSESGAWWCGASKEQVQDVRFSRDGW